MGKTGKMLDNQKESFSIAYDEILKRHISDLVDNQTHNFTILTEKLESFTESLVDKSAVAIGEVQKDNNLRLQELASSLDDLSKKNQFFIEECLKNNTNVVSHINELTDQYRELFENLRKISHDNIDSIDEKIKMNLSELDEKISALNKKQVSDFAQTMEDYRDRFVEANANALANVQIDLTDKIKESNQKIIEITELVKKESDGICKFTVSLKERFDSFITDFEEKNQDNNDSFNDSISEIDGHIKKWTDGIKNNIEEINEKYNESAQNILKNIEIMSQNMQNMNRLTEQDLELLNNLVKE